MKKIKFEVDGKPYEVGWLLSRSSVKTRKGEKLGYLTGITYLDNSTANWMCSHASKACKSSCLKGSGNLGLFDGAAALRVRALFLIHHRQAFIDRLKLEIRALVKSAARANMIPALRLNGSSDIPWEKPEFGSLLQWAGDTFPDLVIYDYTKIPGRSMPEYLDSMNLDKYHVTFSWSGYNRKQCELLLDKGVNVAVPFDVKRGDSLPKTFLGKTVIDGDKTDLRFLDPKGGIIVGLRYKMSWDKPEKGRRMIKAPKFVVNVSE